MEEVGSCNPPAMVPDAAVCPTIAPTPGTSCPGPAGTCTYTEDAGTCNGFPVTSEVMVVCDGGTWEATGASVSSCNPPATVDGGNPSDAGLGGDAADGGG